MSNNPFKELEHLEQNSSDSIEAPHRLRKEVLGSYNATNGAFSALSTFTEKLIDAFTGIMKMLESEVSFTNGSNGNKIDKQSTK